MIFVDTGAWYAFCVPRDADHQAARRWLTGNREPLVTTDYILDELLALLKHRGEFRRAEEIAQPILSIGTAFTFDEHFREFGNVTLVPG